MYQWNTNYGLGYNSVLLNLNVFNFIPDPYENVTSNEVLAEDVILTLLLGTCAQST